MYRYLDDNIHIGLLDDYLSRHEPCRRLVTEIFGSRYPHLNRLGGEEYTRAAVQQSTRERRIKGAKSELEPGTIHKQPKTKQVAFAAEQQLTGEELEIVHDLLMSQNEVSQLTRWNSSTTH